MASTLEATLNANWKQGWKVKGEAQTIQVELKEVVALLISATRLSGNFKFNVQHGVLYGLDLDHAVKSLATQGARGGHGVGPDWGASVGSKAGQALDKLFK